MTRIDLCCTRSVDLGFKSIFILFIKVMIFSSRIKTSIHSMGSKDDLIEMQLLRDVIPLHLSQPDTSPHRRGGAAKPLRGIAYTPVLSQ